DGGLHAVVLPRLRRSGPRPALVHEGTDRGGDQVVSGPERCIVDCDIHQSYRSIKDLYPYLPAVYRDVIEDFGVSMGGLTYPSIAKRATRHDLWKDDQTAPGTDVEQVRVDHLDRYGIHRAIL